MSAALQLMLASMGRPWTDADRLALAEADLASAEHRAIVAEAAWRTEAMLALALRRELNAQRGDLAWLCAVCGLAVIAAIGWCR